MKKYKVKVYHGERLLNPEYLRQCKEFDAEFKWGANYYTMDTIVPYYIMSEDDLVMIRLKYSFSEHFLRIISEST